jgi:hypothetical protein
MHGYGTLKPVEFILRGERRKKNNGGDEPNWGTLDIWKYNNKTPCKTIMN